jgi:heterodisulfide reductase subunit A-like polyferredoxin
MKLGEADPSGRRRPVPLAGSEFTLELDMVVPAIGQSPNLAFLGEGHRFAITREGTFNIDRVSYMTNRPGVFAAGDAITQPVSVIDAIGSAKQAAAGIDAYLRGVEVTDVPFSAREMPISRRDLAPEEVEPKPRYPSPTIPMSRRMRSHAEVELGYDADVAMAEAQRCLMCGPCSECLACEAVCEPKAIRHDQLERIENLEIGAIIWTDGVGSLPSGLNPKNRDRDRSATAHQAVSASSVSNMIPAGGAGPRKGGGNGRQGLYLVQADDPLAGSAAAARVMMELFTERRQAVRSAPRVSAVGAARIGVFVCQCNGQISNTVDTDAVEAQARTWAGVAYTETLDQSCSQEAADAIYQAVADRDLNRVVLAACSCCAVDQVCYSCTYQRVRCKDNLLGRHFDRGNPLFEFVNIREQCAWIHENDPQAATATASAMVAAAVAKTRLSVVRPRASLPLDKTVLILGNGPGATICQGALSTQRIQALRLRTLPRQIRQTPSHFTVIHNGSRLWKGSALVLAPRDEAEHAQINEAFGTEGRRPRTQYKWGCADTHRPGVFICDPSVDAIIAGMAAAARTAAWLGQQHSWPEPMAAVVDPDRCRGCGDCELVCEFGAIQLQPTPRRRLGAGSTEQEEVEHVAWIDPAICRGGGICAAHCPAGAISTGHPSSKQIEAMLEAILS